MIKTILAIVAAGLTALFVFAATKPDTFGVERTTRIQAPLEKIFPLLEDFRQWGAWSPYEKLDPAMKRTFSGAASGKGAVYAWEGNSQAGQGRMEILDTSPPAKVVIQLDFLKPMKAHNTAEFTLEPQGDATKVTWSVSGPASFLSKLMSVFVDMDQLIGKDFETGLQDLKTLTEK